jgi:toxin ParE1/3/4
MQKFKLLAENPKLGRTHDEFVHNLRTFPHKDYVIFYFPIENGVEIYRILHGARDIDSLFDDFFEGLKP